MIVKATAGGARRPEELAQMGRKGLKGRKGTGGLGLAGFGGGPELVPCDAPGLEVLSQAVGVVGGFLLGAAFGEENAPGFGEAGAIQADGEDVLQSIWVAAVSA